MCIRDRRQQRDLHFHRLKHHQHIAGTYLAAHRGLHLPQIAGYRAFHPLLPRLQRRIARLFCHALLTVEMLSLIHI